ncbi:MAG TPA: bifunctional demethylmenaquinone methyltransferase/2-methoxy-6-polyprenyl-1,4-benzoquinol methylase UbiE [Trueperaceae bacterium]
MSRAVAGPAVGDQSSNEDSAPNGARPAEVRSMFSRIAPTYDLLNSLLSLGLDARWRREAALVAVEGAPARALDVATGTGKLAFALKRALPACAVTGVDFSAEMLAVARGAADRSGIDVAFAAADGTALPFADGEFGAVTIGYGLRNFADPDAGLREFRRVLSPGGRLVVLEFPPPPAGPVGAAFRLYFERLLPLVGGLVSGDREAYDYLPRSVGAFMEPDELAARMTQAGFAQVRYRLQTFGVSALHVGVKAHTGLVGGR